MLKRVLGIRRRSLFSDEELGAIAQVVDQTFDGGLVLDRLDARQAAIARRALAKFSAVSGITFEGIEPDLEALERRALLTWNRKLWGWALMVSIWIGIALGAAALWIERGHAEAIANATVAVHASCDPNEMGTDH